MKFSDIMNGTCYSSHQLTVPRRPVQGKDLLVKTVNVGALAIPSEFVMVREAVEEMVMEVMEDKRNVKI